MPLLVRTFLLLLLVALPGALSAQAYTLEPHAPRNTAPDEPRFTQMPEASTGLVIRNTYDDPRMWRERFKENGFGSIATGVAVGDYDADGFIDIYLIDRFGPNKLYRNNGDWTFTDVTGEAGVPGGEDWTGGATFADVDGDADLDLMVFHHAEPNHLYINQGDGTFTEEAVARGLDIATNSVMGAFADYDRDGDLDLYLVTNRLDVQLRKGEPDYLYRNRGGGTFEEVSAEAGIAGDAQTFAAIWWDYNRDGWPDIYVSNDFSVPDRLYRNNGDGTFTDVMADAIPQMAYYSMGADFGDFNNDGWPDLLATDMYPRDHKRFLLNQAELWELQDAQEVRHPPQLMRNTFYVNTGTGRFSEQAWQAGLAASDWTWAVLAADYDNDGLEDLYVTNGMFRDFMNSDVHFRVNSLPANRRNVFWKRQLELREANILFHNQGDLTFEDRADAWGLGHVGVTFGAARADFDNDGDLDLVASEYNDGALLYRNNSTDGNSLTLSLAAPEGNRHGVGARLEVTAGDRTVTRELQLARGIASGLSHRLHVGLGEADKADSVRVFWPDGVVSELPAVPAGHHVHIRKPDTKPVSDARAPEPVEPLFREVSAGLGLAGKAIPEATYILEEIKAQPLLPFRQGRQGPGLSLADRNGDGRPDITLSGAAGSPGRAWIQEAAGVFESVDPALPDDSPDREGLGLLWFAANADALPDRLQANGGVEAAGTLSRLDDRLYSGQPAEDTAPVPELVLAPADRFPVEALASGPVAAADFDGDGDLDLFIGGGARPGAYPLADDNRLLENRRGTFVDVTRERASGLRTTSLVRSALWRPRLADKPGRFAPPDLILAQEWGSLRLFRWIDGTLVDWTERSGLDGQTGLWRSLATGDFNGDGRLDLVAGNLGRNTRYTASPRRPMAMVYGDLTGEGRRSLVEMAWDEGELRPWRGMTELSRGLQSRAFARSLLQRFPDYADYAAATIEEIFDGARLGAARVFAASTLDSTVFLAGKDGRFRSKPLPADAQVAPVQGLTVADFDADGFLDVALSHNSHDPVPQVGRFGGGLGLLLTGDGAGGFTPVPHRESGLVIPGDARGLGTLDVNGDGRPDLVAARNRATLLAFVQQPDVPGSGRPLAVRLAGPAGNPTGIGARVTAHYADGSSATQAVTAGSGYLTQESGTVFFGAGADTPVAGLEVVWPDGSVLSLDAPAGMPVPRRVLLTPDAADWSTP
ncbi:MAG: FG-GAP-like repeat-containing protein [Opitutales bacterium]